MKIKQQTNQKFIYKIHSTRLRKSNWNLKLKVSEAMRSGEIIALADSTLLRFIDELNNIENSDEKVKEIRTQINKVKKSDSITKKQDLRKLYTELNTIQFKKDYLCLIIDSEKDYYRAINGFKINGIEYSRLLATNGGVKGQTIVFTSKELKPKLREKIDNGRNLNKELVPAKFGAYESLVCSSSVVVSDPKKILVVKDCEVDFLEDVIKLDDSEGGEPKMTYIENYKIHKNINDGFGLCLPSVSKQWANDLGLDYIPAGFITRPYAFSKGILVTFDFIDFANNVAKKSIVKDAWGNEVNIHDIDVIITTSMLKLWDSYDNFEHYMENCIKNNYKFCITKTTPKELEHTRNLNYQFIQSYRLNDNQINDLIKPTIDEIKESLGDDYRKSLLFLRGTNITEQNANDIDLDFVKALQINNQMINDNYVRTSIYKMIKKRIKEAKTGVIKINGNFQTACGDPYALCQHIFGLEVTGLLKKGEFYSKYWIDKNVDNVVCFRAPMTCHNNIRTLYLPNRDDMQYWYKYINTMVIFNSWDTTTDAENGEDFDGDSNLLTDNEILVKNHRVLPTVMCIQRKAPKTIITEESLIKANIASFGDDIGKYTNGITSQFDVQSQFDIDSEEYKTLEYRIICGQMFQQNAIDKTKGIIAKPRPRNWFDYKVNKIKDTDKQDIRELKTFYKRIVANKKPYFMQYIYPQEKRTFRKYVEDSNKKCQTEFKFTIDELKQKPNKTTQEREFLEHYKRRMPVGDNSCIINKICWIFEKEFDTYLKNYVFNKEFDYSILKCKDIDEESQDYVKNKKSIEIIYKDYCDRVSKYQQRIKKERIDEEESATQRVTMLRNFTEECILKCPNEEMLANIVLDICYLTNKSKQFAWDMCGNVFIDNLLKQNDYMMHYPTRHPNGDIEFNGEKFIMKGLKIKSEEGDVY